MPCWVMSYESRKKRTTAAEIRLVFIAFSFCSAALAGSESPRTLLPSTPTRTWWCAGSTEQDFEILLSFQRACCCLMDLQAVACCKVAGRCLPQTAASAYFFYLNDVSYCLHMSESSSGCVLMLFQGILWGITAPCQCFKQKLPVNYIADTEPRPAARGTGWQAGLWGFTSTLWRAWFLFADQHGTEGDLSDPKPDVFSFKYRWTKHMQT